jgi:hypothetical protein
MDRIECESFRLGCPDFAHVFVGCEATQVLEAAAEVVGADEGVEMGFELLGRRRIVVEK